jgi:putative tryptophan/tyrosine transport system substrate-binding protein
MSASEYRFSMKHANPISAAKNATSTIPIVFSAVLDPVPLGYATSLDRPGGNVTGVTSFDPQQATQQFKLLKEILPKLSRVAILSDQNIPRAQDGWSPFEKAYEAAAETAGLTPRWIRVEGPKPDLAGAFTTIANEQLEAVVVLEVPVTLMNLKTISELAARHRLPTMFPAGWPNDGLISFGTSILNATPRIPIYVERILKGEHPADMAIEGDHAARTHYQSEDRGADRLVHSRGNHQAG